MIIKKEIKVLRKLIISKKYLLLLEKMKYQNQITKPKLLIETKLKIKIKEYI